METDEEFWKQQLHYWRSPKHNWRTRGTVSQTREAFLAQQLNMTPSISKGIYPFKDVRLDRRDVEWLLERSGTIQLLSGTPSLGEGSVGHLDLRGADLHSVVLEYLPLPGLWGGLSINEWNTGSPVERDAAAVHMENAVLNNTYLSSARLCGAFLQNACINQAYMLRAELVGARMDHSCMIAVNAVEAHLDGADLVGSRLTGANFNQASLRGTLLRNVVLRDATIQNADLTGADLTGADLTGADLTGADLTGADLTGAQLRDVRIQGARLERVKGMQ